MLSTRPSSSLYSDGIFSNCPRSTLSSNIKTVSSKLTLQQILTIIENLPEGRGGSFRHGEAVRVRNPGEKRLHRSYRYSGREGRRGSLRRICRGSPAVRQLRNRNGRFARHRRKICRWHHIRRL